MNNETIESSNSLLNDMNMNSYYYNYKQASNTTRICSTPVHKYNKSHSTCINEDNQTISSIERKDMNVFSKETIQILNDIRNTIKSIQLLENANSNENTNTNRLINKQPTAMFTFNNMFNKKAISPQHHERHERNSIYVLSPQMTKQHSTVFKRMSLPCLNNVDEMSHAFEANFIFAKFTNTKDFLEYTYSKLLSGNYRLVSELLKLHLKHKYTDTPDKRNEKLTQPRHLLNDINVLNKTLIKTNIPTKIRELYRNTPLYSKMLPKIQKLISTEQTLSHMDKTLVKAITSKE